MTRKILLLRGTVRPTGNGMGLTKWVERTFERTNREEFASQFQLVTPDEYSHLFPIGPVVQNELPAAIDRSEEYDHPNVREWSKIVRECQGVIVVTPQYNWSFPGPLKDSLDVLFKEWAGKPVLIVTYGGRGGGKCGEHLHQVMEGGLKMKPLAKHVEICLPREYTGGKERIDPDALPQFVEIAQKDLDESLLSLFSAVTDNRMEKETREH